jgi:hypothetical protein
MLSSKSSYVPYQGTEQIKFLHNNSDTQVFIGQGSETYYITEPAITEGDCAKDYESVRVKFLNQTTNDLITLAYERDRSLFSINPSYGHSDNQYTYYKVSYKNKTFNTEVFTSINNTIIINNVGYQAVTYIGGDTTSNYVGYKWGKGILRIRVNSENWDLIP